MNLAKTFTSAMNNSNTYMMCSSLFWVNLSTCTFKLIFSVNSKLNCLRNSAFSSDYKVPLKNRKHWWGPNVDIQAKAS